MTGARTIAFYAAILIASLWGFAAFPGLLPHFTEIWGLSSSQSGWINGIYFGAYMVAVPVLVSLTDRVDGRAVFMVGAAIACLAQLGFAFLAEGFWSALAWRALAGVGLAGTYMQGLKVLSDRIDPRLLSRAVAYYTSSFSIGLASSFWLLGELNDLGGWRWANALLAIGPAGALLAMTVFVRPQPVAHHERPATRLLDFRPVLRERRAMAYILAYAAHNWELFASRSWMVAYLVFAKTRQDLEAVGLTWSETTIATLVVVLGLPASVLGNEGSRLFGRRRVIYWVMGLSALVSCAFGLASGLPYWLLVLLCLVYGVSVTADSSSITAGAVAAAPEGLRGTTMALHAMIGFAGATLGPIVFGLVLDLGGGMESATAWALAFASAGLMVATGPLFVRFMIPRGVKE